MAQAFLDHFYAVSDDRNATQQYIDSFEPDAFLAFANTVTPISQVGNLRKAMWDGVVSRKHTIHSWHELGNDQELAIFGKVDLSFENGHTVSKEEALLFGLSGTQAPSIQWSALMKLNSTKTKMTYYYVYLDTTPAREAKGRPKIAQNTDVEQLKPNMVRLASGKEIFVHKTGSGPVILLQHGLGSSSAFYGAMLDVSKLAESYTILNVDFDGHGLSSFSGKVTIDTLAQDIIDILDAFSIEKAAIVGHSVSGLVVLTAAAKYPDRITKVVSIGGVRPSEAGAKGMRARAEKARTEGLEPISHAVADGALSKKTKAENRNAYHFVRSLVRANKVEPYTMVCEAIASAKEPDYSSIKSPALLVTGTEDVVAPPKAALELKAEMKAVSVVEMDNCGHWHAIEDPEKLGMILQDFLAN